MINRSSLLPKVCAASAPLAQYEHPADRLYSALPLGAIYQPQATTFRVFAPTASRVILHLYQTPIGGQGDRVDLRQNPDGTWETTVSGNLVDQYYTYSADGEDPGFRPQLEVPDPYSHCVTSCDGRSLILGDLAPICDRPDFLPSEAIVYELHLRDYTIDPDSGVQRRGKYLGMTEFGTHLPGHPKISTGLDHLVDLGVNTVQIMPFNEFTSDEKNDAYGWGYDPGLYQTPDGWYCSQALDASRVHEARRMIDCIHRNGLRVVMDVVLNHTDEALRRRGNAFEALVPGYYYRRRPDQSYYDGACCGNEIRSEAPMVRRFIKDTLKYWVQDYKVDGFRLDLMGLMDRQTAAEVALELHKIDPKLLLYGEPWAPGQTPIEVFSKGHQKNLGLGVFNDNFRDALKGSVFHPAEQGYVQSGCRLEAVCKGIAGSLEDFSASPLETINYVECHDNHTLWDRLTLSTQNHPGVSEADRKSMDRLAAAIVLSSQGIPFIQSGQEMLRSKNGDDNSYNKPDSVNMLRWQLKRQNYEIFAYYKGLIALRKAHPMFRLTSATQVRQGLRFQKAAPPGVIAYSLVHPGGQDSWKRAQVVFNARPTPQRLPLPNGRWQVYVDGQQAQTRPLLRSEVKIQPGYLTVPPRSAVILGES